MSKLHRVVADIPLGPEVQQWITGQVELIPWQVGVDGNAGQVDGVYTYGHPLLDGKLLDRMQGVRIISNFGVGVDHISLPDAAARGIPVCNTPGILEATTADLAFALLLAAGRRIVEGDRYARSPEFIKYDPNRMLGTEVHGQALGIVGLGNIGYQVARRGRACDMPVVYHNRRRRPEIEGALEARFVELDELLAVSDYVVLTLPLTAETRGLIGKEQLGLMKPTAILVNVARGPVVDTAAITEALANRTIHAAALDVTDPEPLPRSHPLLALDNLTITPHLGSATVQTRRQMGQLSVENLLAGLRGEELKCRVKS